MCRSDIDMARSLKENNLPPVRVLCGFNNCFGFKDGIFTMSLEYRTKDGPVRNAYGAPFLDFGTASLNIPPITKGCYYFEACILLHDKRPHLAWQVGWANSEFKITQPKSSLLGVRVIGPNGPKKFVVGRLRKNARQGIGDDHEGNSYAFDPIRHQKWYKDLPPVEGRYMKYTGTEFVKMNPTMTDNRKYLLKFQTIQKEGTENVEIGPEFSSVMDDDQAIELDGRKGTLAIRRIGPNNLCVIDFEDEKTILISVEPWRGLRTMIFVCYEPNGEEMSVSKYNKETLLLESLNESSEWKATAKQISDTFHMHINPSGTEESCPFKNEEEVQIADLYDRILKVPADKADVSTYSLWSKIRQKRENFGYGKTLGCCLNCEEKTISYWIDDELVHDATFRDVEIKGGMVPCLSFSGMLPSKLVVRGEAFKYKNRGTPISVWWDKCRESNAVTKIFHPGGLCCNNDVVFLSS